MAIASLQAMNGPLVQCPMPNWFAGPGRVGLGLGLGLGAGQNMRKTVVKICS